MEYVAVGRRSGSTTPTPAHADQPVAHPQSKRTRKPSQQQQRRLDLEQEVAELKKQLWNEQAVHDILHRALHRPLPPANANSDTPPSLLRNIPAFIPPKAKELLAELVLVEEEIARLEAQIETMKKKKDTDSTTSIIHHHHHQQQQQQPPSTDNNIITNANNNGIRGGDANIKSMFFISQAINGDTAAATATHSSHHPHLGGSIMSPKLPPSPKLPTASRNSVDNNSNTSPTKKTLQPNKLSERIVKCLICIFIRLLRSSRVAELQDSNTTTTNNSKALGRQLLQQHQGGGASFRIDTGLMMNKQQQEECRSGQQDHYGIFAIPDSIVRDIGPYKNLVSFTSSSFDLRSFSTSPLLTKLRGMLEALQHVDLRFLTHQQKLAFWLNIYNTCIMHGILHNGLPSSSEKLLALKNKATLNVSGQKFNALVIENFILRQPSSVKEEFWKCEVDVEEQQVRGRYGLNTSEPNILFAMCCGIRSSPALRIYKADRVMMDLEKAKLEYLQASLVVTTSTTRRLMIPSLIHSNMHDFAKDMDSLLRWIIDQLPTSWSLRKSMVDCLRVHHSSHHHHLNIQDLA
uniref:DUF547 domain-containing protein n=1 Tax=Leersia perrieri TaxID=77586 RepID=A0A0D9W1N3_9ORYZ